MIPTEQIEALIKKYKTWVTNIRARKDAGESDELEALSYEFVIEDLEGLL